jgi:hypothetical protein
MAYPHCSFAGGIEAALIPSASFAPSQPHVACTLAPMFPKIESLEGFTFIQRATAEQCEKLLRGVSLTLDGRGKIAVQQRGALPRGSELRQHYAHLRNDCGGAESLFRLQMSKQAQDSFPTDQVTVRKAHRHPQ